MKIFAWNFLAKSMQVRTGGDEKLGIKFHWPYIYKLEVQTRFAVLQFSQLSMGIFSELRCYGYK